MHGSGAILGAQVAPPQFEGAYADACATGDPRQLSAGSKAGAWSDSDSDVSTGPPGSPSSELCDFPSLSEVGALLKAFPASPSSTPPARHVAVPPSRRRYFARRPVPSQLLLRRRGPPPQWGLRATARSAMLTVDLWRLPRPGEPPRPRPVRTGPLADTRELCERSLLGCLAGVGEVFRLIDEMRRSRQARRGGIKMDTAETDSDRD